MEQLYNYILFGFGIIEVGRDTVVIDWDWYDGMRDGYRARGLVNYDDINIILDGGIHNISGCEYLRFNSRAGIYKWDGEKYVWNGTII